MDVGRTAFGVSGFELAANIAFKPARATPASAGFDRHDLCAVNEEDDELEGDDTGQSSAGVEPVSSLRRSLCPRHNEKPGRARRHSRTGTGCESTLEQVETRREERKNTATPWILLKSMVLVVFGMHAEPAKPTSLELM